MIEALCEGRGRDQKLWVEVKVQIQTGPEGTDRESSISFLMRQTHTVRQWRNTPESGAVTLLVWIHDRVLDIFWFGVPRITGLSASGNRTNLETNLIDPSLQRGHMAQT